MSFDETVLKLASPALCGIKPSCLFSMDRETFLEQFHKIKKWNSQLKGCRLVVLKTRRTYLIFAYDRLLLSEILSVKRNLEYLSLKDYPVDSTLDGILSELFRRICVHSSGNFPHEVGVFLGYPIDDVIAFEKNRGRGCMYTGCWEVYGDVENACRKMNEYKKCSARCRALFKRGFNVVDITRIYKDNRFKEVC